MLDSFTPLDEMCDFTPLKMVLRVLLKPTTELCSHAYSVIQKALIHVLCDCLFIRPSHFPDWGPEVILLEGFSSLL